MKKILVITLSILLVSALSITAMAEISVKVNSGKSSNYRDEPSLDGEKLGALTSGQTLPFAYDSSVDDRGVTWYLAELDDGSKVWLSSKYTCLTDGTTDGFDFSGSGEANEQMKVTEDDTLVVSPYKGVGDVDVSVGDIVTDSGCFLVIEGEDKIVYEYVTTADGESGWMHADRMTLASYDDDDADEDDDDEVEGNLPEDDDDAAE